MAAPTPNIFQLTDELLHLESVVMDFSGNGEAGEIPPEIERLLDKTQEDFQGKVDGYCTLISNLEALARARKDEAKRMADLAASSQAAADRLLLALHWAMKKQEIQTLTTKTHKLWRQGAGGKTPMEISEDDVPELYKKTVAVVDKEAIREALEKGEQVPGAKLLPRGETLRIR